MVVQGVYAQDRTISGKVSSADDGVPLPGVNILLKGSTNGTVTDAGGNYRIVIPAAGGTLIFSFIGMVSQKVAVTSQQVVDISLTSDSQQLGEVVITAMGVKRDVKSLPYAAQQVSSEKLSITRANNINDALAGKVAGVQLRGQ